jgi:transposase
MNKRNKYDYKFRLQCIEAIVKDKCSISAVARKKGVNITNLRLWYRFYEQYGKDGLKERKYQFYPTSFKLLVIQAIDKEFLSLRGACARFNIPSESTIVNWKKVYETEGVAGLNAKRKGRPPMMSNSIKPTRKKAKKPLTREEELLKENEYLRAENDLLKKLQALVQADKKHKP